VLAYPVNAPPYEDLRIPLSSSVIADVMWPKPADAPIDEVIRAYLLLI
jgi:hypothetical protein